MTCRFAIEFEGKDPYPRSCPTCGFGSCNRGYEQVKLTPEQGARLGFHYVIVSPDGKPEREKQAKWNTVGSGIPAQVLVAMTNKRAKPETPEDAPLIGHVLPEPIPAGVYFHIDNFYDTKTRHGKGHDFWLRWRARKNEFPTEPQPKLTPAEIGDAAWRGRAQEAIDAAAQPNVGIKLSRVQRARILDTIELTLHEAKADCPEYRVDKATEELFDKIFNIMNET